MQANRSATILVPLLGVALVAVVVASAWLAWQPSGEGVVARADVRSDRDDTSPPATLPRASGSTTELSAVVPAAPGATTELSAPVPPTAGVADEHSVSPPEVASDAESPSEPLPPPSDSTDPARPAAPSPAPGAEQAAAAAAPVASTNISGAWLLSNEVQSTSYAPFRGLRLSYRAQLVQDGAQIVGSGVKWAENGRTLPDGQRTPITFEGRIENHTVSLRFSEQGKRRPSRGVLTWSLAPSGDEMHGTFSSSAASSSGVSSARRFPG